MLKSFFQPVAPYHVNQRFGEDTVCVDKKTRSKFINCDGSNPPAGYRSAYGSKGHQGLDLRAKTGQPIHCALEGTVEYTDNNKWSGIDVRIRSKSGGIEYLHIYEHLTAYRVQLGQKVKTGEIIGWAGNTGVSTGAHLHFEIRQLVGSKWVSINPEPLMFNIFAREMLYLFDLLRMKAIDLQKQLK